MKTNTREELYRSTAREELAQTLRKSVSKMISKVLRNMFYYIKIIRVLLSGIINLVFLIPTSKGQSIINSTNPFPTRVIEPNIHYKMTLSDIASKLSGMFPVSYSKIYRFRRHFFKIIFTKNNFPNSTKFSI